MTELFKFKFSCLAYGIACDRKNKTRCECSVEGESMMEAKQTARNVMKRECNNAIPSADGWERLGIIQADLFDAPSPDGDSANHDREHENAKDCP